MYVGITTCNIVFIKLVLLGQVIVFFSQASVEFIRGWILLHIGTRVNISLVSDFLIKLMKFTLEFINFELILVTKNIFKLMGVGCFH